MWKAKTYHCYKDCQVTPHIVSIPSSIEYGTALLDSSTSLQNSRAVHRLQRTQSSWNATGRTQRLITGIRRQQFWGKNSGAFNSMQNWWSWKLCYKSCTVPTITWVCLCVTFGGNRKEGKKEMTVFLFFLQYHKLSLPSWKLLALLQWDFSRTQKP